MAERGMGRGLAAILSNTEVATAAEATDHHGPGPAAGGYANVSVERITPNPAQPRRVFEQDALASLAGSIESQGVLQPVLVRPSGPGEYEIVAGERRWRAAKLAGMATVPVVITERTDAESLEAALVENMAREDLNPVEEARAVAGLVEELGLTREDVGRRIGRSRVAVSNLVRLLDLPSDVLTLLEERKLTEGHGRALLSAPDHDDRRRLAHDAVAGAWSVRTTEERARAAAGRQTAIVRTRTIHPDQLAAAEEITEILGRALGTEIRVNPVAGGYRASFVVDSPDAAQALANRVPRGAQASR